MKTYDSRIGERANTPFAKWFSTNVKKSKELAEKLGITPQAVNQYKAGTALPKTEHLVKIAQIYGVSLDYIFGLSKVSKRNPDLRAAQEYTGLSESAIENVRIHSAMSGIDYDLSLVLNNGIFYSIVNSLDDLRYAYNRCVDSINIIQEYEKTHPQKKQYGITLDELAENEELSEAVDTLSEWFPPLRMQLFELTEQWTRFIESEFPNQELIADGKELYQKYVRSLDNGKH